MYYEKISFLSLAIAEHQAEYDWFTANIEPTYRDSTDLNEHLFSVDAEYNAIHGETQELPPFIEAFLNNVKAVSEEVSYIRFVNY
jgi:hypothetical protein